MRSTQLNSFKALAVLDGCNFVVTEQGKLVQLITESYPSDDDESNHVPNPDKMMQNWSDEIEIQFPECDAVESVWFKW